MKKIHNHVPWNSTDYVRHLNYFLPFNMLIPITRVFSASILCWEYKHFIWKCLELLHIPYITSAQLSCMLRMFAVKFPLDPSFTQLKVPSPCPLCGFLPHGHPVSEFCVKLCPFCKGRLSHLRWVALGYFPGELRLSQRKSYTVCCIEIHLHVTSTQVSPDGRSCGPTQPAGLLSIEVQFHLCVCFF